MAIKGKCTECPGNPALFSVFDLGICKRTPLMPLQLKCCHFHHKLLFLGVLVYNSTVLKKKLHSDSCISSFNLRENFTKNLKSWQFHHFKFGRNQMKKMSVVLNAFFFVLFHQLYGKICFNIFIQRDCQGQFF